MSDDKLKDDEILVNGKKISGGSLISLNIKTAIIIISSIVSLVMSILTYSYFDLKNTVEEKHKTFVEKVESDLAGVSNDVQNIRVDQAEIKGDIKLILDRQTRNLEPTHNNQSYVPVQIQRPPITIPVISEE